jgi:hypothetical protein
VLETDVDVEVDRELVVETDVEREPLFEAEPEAEGLEAVLDPDREEPVFEPAEAEPEAEPEPEPLPLPLPLPEFADCDPPGFVAEPFEWEVESVNPPEPLSELEEHAASATTAVVDNRREGNLMTRVPSARCSGIGPAASERIFFVERIWMT